MKTTVYLLILLCGFACSRNNPQAKKEAITPVVKESVSKYIVDTRAGKSALYYEKEMLTSYDYDSISLCNPHPVLMKGNDKYLGFGKLSYAFKIHGPFQEVEFINNLTIKVKGSGNTSKGYIMGSSNSLFMFDYPEVEPRSTKLGVFELTDDGGRRGVYSYFYAVDSSSFVLPMDYYLAVYTEDRRICDMGCNWWHNILEADYFKADAIGQGYAASNKRYDYYYTRSVKETKLVDIFGHNVKAIVATKAKTAIVESSKGYGLIDIEGAIIVPALFYKYELIGDSAIQFMNPDEIIKLNIAGKKII